MSETGLLILAVMAPVVGVAFWIAVTTGIGALAGWFRLMHRFPDQPNPARLKLTWQSGSMGFGVNYNNVLRISVCEAGLRMGVPRMFGVFARDFLVPWRDIRVKRYRRFFIEFVELTFGDPSVGRLVVRAKTADLLKAAVPTLWPERTGA